MRGMSNERRKRALLCDDDDTDDDDREWEVVYVCERVKFLYE